MAQFFKPKPKKKPTQKHQTFQVVKTNNHFEGIAYDGKKPVFIAGALPNESVLAHLLEDKRHYARAQLIKVLMPSEQRITPFCPLNAQCGGCQLQHLGLDEQRGLKQKNLLDLMHHSLTAKTQIAPMIADAGQGYRRRIRLSVKINGQGQLNIGFRKRNSHDIVEVAQCPVLSEAINEVLPKLHGLIDGLKGRRIIGHLEFVQGENTLVLLVRAIKSLHQEDIDQLIAFAQSARLSLYLREQDQPAKRLLGDAPEYLSENMALTFEPDDFIQVNAAVNQKMIAQAIDWLKLNAEDQVLDLFCGLGNFSLPIARQVRSLVGVEGVEKMVRRAQDNASQHGLSQARFYHADLTQDLSDCAWAKQSYDKILLDPARAGALDLMPYLAASGASRIVYVSCDPLTLARDSAELTKQGYRLARLGMLDMFPHTAHLESMALFVRNS